MNNVVNIEFTNNHNKVLAISLESKSKTKKNRSVVWGRHDMLPPLPEVVFHYTDVMEKARSWKCANDSEGMDAVFNLFFFSTDSLLFVFLVFCFCCIWVWVQPVIDGRGIWWSVWKGEALKNYVPSTQDLGRETQEIKKHPGRSSPPKRGIPLLGYFKCPQMYPSSPTTEGGRVVANICTTLIYTCYAKSFWEGKQHPHWVVFHVSGVFFCVSLLCTLKKREYMQMNLLVHIRWL